MGAISIVAANVEERGKERRGPRAAEMEGRRCIATLDLQWQAFTMKSMEWSEARQLIDRLVPALAHQSQAVRRGQDKSP